MTASDVIVALDLPLEARVDLRVPKTLLVERGAPTAADRRRIQGDIEEMRWTKTLKPSTIGVPAYRDEVREVLELIVLTVTLRPRGKAERLGELIHRAVPYPVFLIAAQDTRLVLSLAHKRRSLGEAGAVVLEGEPVTAVLGTKPDAVEERFLEALALPRQPRDDLYHLYQGWIDALLALLAGRVTGSFSVASSPEGASARREALRQYARLDGEIARLRAAAARERQVSKQVAWNLELKRAEAARAAARARL